MKILIYLIFAALIMAAEAAVYEARNSDDVDFFMVHNPEEMGALLFYDKGQEKDSQIANQIAKVQGIFKNIGEEGREIEKWVDSLNDKVHLMRVDTSSLDNLRSKNDYHVSKTPMVILLDNGQIQLMEVLSNSTYDHIKDYYSSRQAEKTNEKKVSTQPVSLKPDSGSPYRSPSSNSPTDDAIAKAQKAADDAKKAAEEAKKALAETQKAFKEHVDKTQKDDDSSKNQKSAQGSSQSSPSNNQNSQNNPSQIEYIPVMRKLDQPATQYAQPTYIPQYTQTYSPVAQTRLAQPQRTQVTSQTQRIQATTQPQRTQVTTTQRGQISPQPATISTGSATQPTKQYISHDDHWHVLEF
jgi:hypothetical protein